ncbi:hypothetical protein SAMN05216410_1721 [Sanguibacter gelidistatuariae]|uniref:Peptidoglycan binding domain-containing protein n=1 Tax=Sanguibacter gelidistatuariae TaxID=1814289 RepID=A0A1G6L090_9MICO|nr:hypothetical protein [Sanguibacter gelidistatuariae]SDC36135.1 hypothetical protein SAMN05216410_1721 [Sanguibacter gelidistatuariae]
MSGAGRGTALLRGHRVIWLIAIVAVLSLAAGMLLSRFIQSPSDAAAKAQPPTAGLITVPVENRVIANDVTMRADVLYDEAVEVKIETGEISGAAVVTGKVPEVGTELAAASILLEIAGRPVIALPGELPAFRSLRVGVSGPDVIQLKQALASLGIDPGNVESDLYDARTAAAVDKLYVMAGYPSPVASADAAAALTGARASLASAKDMLTAADAELTTAKSGPTKAERLAADNEVNSAQRALNTAIAVRDAPAEVDADGVALPKDIRGQENDVADAQDRLNLVIVQRDAVIAGTGTAAQQTARNSASQAVKDAETELALALEATLTSLPASEITYFAALPRRVDQVTVTRGETVTSAKAVMSVSGANIVVSGSVAGSDADLLEAGMTGTFPLPDGTTSTATITEIKAAEKTGTDEGDTGDSGTTTGRFTVLFTPDALTPEQIATLQGSNIKVTIGVNSTGDKVLAVPSAALTAGPGGESRVERKVTGDTTELIKVETGLAAGGYVQIVSSEIDLTDGDLVVVGK